MEETVRTYGKYILTGAVGVGLGVGGYTVTDTPTEQTQTYQNLQNQLDTAQANADNFEAQVQDLETTVTDKEERVSTLESQVEQFRTTVEELRSENEDLEDAVAQAQERVGLVDHLPYFSNADIEFESVNTVADAQADEGEYDAVYVDYEHQYEGHSYSVDVEQYEEAEDADDREEEIREDLQRVDADTSSSTHTVDVTTDLSEGLDRVVVQYEDSPVEDVDTLDDIESVVVNGEDIKDDHATGIARTGDSSEVEVEFDGDYNLNDGDNVQVVYSDAETSERLDTVWVNKADYDYSEDLNEFVYRNGNTVVYGEATEDDSGEDFQYEAFRSQYE